MSYYQFALKLAGLHRPQRWFGHPRPMSAPEIKRRESVAWSVLTATERADQGATRAAHRADCARIDAMQRLLRADWTPAQAVAYLDELEV